MFELLLLLIIVYLGLFSGFYLSLICVEELIAGRKYFFILERFLFSGIVFLILFQFLGGLSFGLALSLIVALVFLFIRLSLKLIYLLFPFVLYFSDGYVRALIAGLMFLFGIAAVSRLASLFVNKRNIRKFKVSKIKIIKEIMQRTNFYFISSLIMLLISLLQFLHWI